MGHAYDEGRVTEWVAPLGECRLSEWVTPMMNAE